MKIVTEINKRVLFILILFFSLTIFSCQKPTNTIPPDTGQPSNLPERIIKDTSYGSDARNKMDIYLPAGRTGTTNVIVMLHGGGWTAGDKNEMNFLVDRFRAKWPQVAIINMNYRYANGSTIVCNTILSDIRRAIELVVNNKKTFQVSDKVALLGGSAGAHLALQYAYTQNQDGRIKCVADLFGPSVLNDWQLYNSVFPLNYKELMKNINGKEHLLVTTLSTHQNSYKVNDSTVTFWGETWVTVAPEMKDFFKNYKYISDSLLQLNVLQLLGMPASNSKYIIAEFWVDVDSLFRPCPDNEITDKKADLYLPANVNSDYHKWYKDNILRSYFPNVGEIAYPWTRLGYTYNWAIGANEIGLSEFVVKKNTKIYIQSNQSIYDYIIKNRK